MTHLPAIDIQLAAQTCTKTMVEIVEKKIQKLALNLNLLTA